MMICLLKIKLVEYLKVVKNIKYDEYLIWNKAILIDQTGKHAKEFKK